MAVSPAEHNERKRRIEVKGVEMAYVDVGEGEPNVVLLHGNPTSSFLWREVIEALRPARRCIAPDLIGMGDSGKLPDPGPRTYTFLEHRRYLDALLDRLDLSERIYLVCHDWGSALAFSFACRNPDRIAGIAYMEAIVKPVSWDEWPAEARRAFQGLRSEAGERMALEDNFFVERILPSSILRELSEEEMNEYRRPFVEPGEGRRPTLTWPRQLPIGGEPADVVAIVEAYGEFLAGSEIPKLFIDVDPGAILTGSQRDFCRSWPNQKEVTVRGAHFVQEDSGDQIGEAIAEWIESLG